VGHGHFSIPDHLAMVRHAGSAVSTIHAMGPDTYLVEREGEVSLLSRERMVSLLTQLSKGESHEQLGGGDVG
jgi:hypothetical protein